MKKEPVTFYVFALPRYREDERRAKPRLLRLEGIEMNPGRRGASRVKLTKASPQLGHATIVSRSNLDLTPESALERYVRDITDQLQRARKELALAEWRYATRPHAPGKVHEDV